MGQAETQRRPLLSAVGSRPLLSPRLREELVASLAKSAALKGLGDQILAIANRSPALEGFASHNAKWREQVLNAVDMSGVLDSLNAQQRERHSQLMETLGRSPVIEEAFKNWKLKLPPGLAEQMASYQAGLIADFASDVHVDAVNDESIEVWFGAESWDRLIWEMVLVLRCAALMTAGMVGAKTELGVPFPGGVLYLLAFFIAAGELAAHLAKDAIDSQDAAS